MSAESVRAPEPAGAVGGAGCSAAAIPPSPLPLAPSAPAAGTGAAFAAALAGLPFMAWDRLARLLARHGAAEAWQRVRDGAEGEAWARAAGAVDVEAVAEAHATAGVVVLVAGEDGYPEPLAGDPERPPVLFARGRLELLAGRRAGVVGTRRCTHYGRDTARDLGRSLAAAGVHVVSGLAAGIDGAAHDGALAAGAEPAGGAAAPIAVVGSGLDVVYPRRHRHLWDRVAEHGLVLSEAPLGCQPAPWRFPARNRVIAALSEVLVVVESRAAGGSMHTVRAADARGVPILAVPGPVRSPASEGTNLLLFEGCSPARDADDVLSAMSLAGRGPVPAPRAVSGAGTSSPPCSPVGIEALVLDALDWDATPLDVVLGRTGRTPPEVSTALARLEEAGWVAGDAGWWRRVAR